MQLSSRAAKCEIYKKKLLGPKFCPEKNYFWKKNYPGGGGKKRGEEEVVTINLRWEPCFLHTISCRVQPLKNKEIPTYIAK